MQVVQELRATLREMATLQVTEAVVNVTLDRTLLYSVDPRAFGGLNESDASWEMVSVRPEEPLENVLASYCPHHGLDQASCCLLRSNIEDLIARDWGCVFEPSSNAAFHHNATWSQYIELAFVINGVTRLLLVLPSQDVAVEVVRFCRQWILTRDDCGRVTELVLDNVSEIPAFQGHAQRAAKKSSLMITSPVAYASYAIGERVDIGMNWTQIAAHRAHERVCLYIDNERKPSYCGRIPLETELAFGSSLIASGRHEIYVMPESSMASPVQSDSCRDKQEDILAAVHIMIEPATVELRAMDIAVHNDESTYLNVQIQTTRFNILDPSRHLCVFHNGDFQCLEPRRVFVERRDLNASRVMIIRAPVFPASDGPHLLSVLLLDENKRCFAKTKAPISFSVKLEDGKQSLPLDPDYFLDLSISTPQRPRVCPQDLQTGPLSWVCNLWRHEWGLHSLNGEDGVLEAVFHHIGERHRYALSIVDSVEDDNQASNTLYWHETYNWTRLTLLRPHTLDLLSLMGWNSVPKEIDLLSVDMQFNGFWILEALDSSVVSPRVIVMRINSHISPEHRVVVKYDATREWDGVSDYYGASVGAVTFWAEQNGFSLVYCESRGVSCVLVRDDALGAFTNLSSLLPAAELYAPPNIDGQGKTFEANTEPIDSWEWLR